MKPRPWCIGAAISNAMADESSIVRLTFKGRAAYRDLDV
uniref:Uncharacterized protein n=1 Tax=Anguilla anguilla TaxID=7936 RepID=A0A0E9P647_ANGAN